MMVQGHSWGPRLALQGSRNKHYPEPSPRYHHHFIHFIAALLHCFFALLLHCSIASFGHCSFYFFNDGIATLLLIASALHCSWPHCLIAPWYDNCSAPPAAPARPHSNPRRYLLPDKSGCTPLHWAASRGNGEACKVSRAALVEWEGAKWRVASAMVVRCVF